MGDRGGHFAQRRQPVAQPLAFLKLLDPRRVLEVEHLAGHCLCPIDNSGERVAKHLVRFAQFELAAVWKICKLECGFKHL